MEGPGVVDRFLGVFTTYIDSGFGLLGGEVAFIATTLIVVDVTLAALFWSLGEGEDVVARLIRKTLFIGAFAYLIGNWNNLARIIFESFAGLGLKASGTGFTVEDLLRPGRVGQAGIDAGRPLLESISGLMGYVAFFENFIQIAVLLIAWLIVVLSFFVAARGVFIEGNLARVVDRIDHAPHRFGLAQQLALGQQPKGLTAAFTDGDEVVAAGLAALLHLRFDHQGLEQTLVANAGRAGLDVLGAVADAADVLGRGLQLVEGDFTHLAGLDQGPLGLAGGLSGLGLSRHVCLLGGWSQAQSAPAALPVGETGGASGGAASRGPGCRAWVSTWRGGAARPKLGGRRSEVRRGRSPKPRGRGSARQKTIFDDIRAVSAATI